MLVSFAGESTSPTGSPRSSCSTPGAASSSKGARLQALVFGPGNGQTCQQQQHEPAASSTAEATPPSISCQQLLCQHGPRMGPGRRASVQDLRRAASHEHSLQWGRHCNSSNSHHSQLMLKTVASLGANGSGSSSGRRGSISTAKLVLAEAADSMSAGQSLGSFSAATADAGVLSHLLSIICQGGCIAPDSKAEPAAIISNSNTVVGTANPLVGSQQKQWADDKQLVQKVVDCIDTLKYLCMDDANCMVLIDLGAIELLINKLQESAGCTDVMVSALAALCAICKHDDTKQRFWNTPGSDVVFRLLASRKQSAVQQAAQKAAAQLAWSVDSGGGSSYSNSGSIFDSVGSSSHHSSTDSTSSSCLGANVLLAPAFVPALAGCLHPADDATALVATLKLLTKAASSTQVEAPVASGSSNSSVFMTQQQQRSAWPQVVFSLKPLLSAVQRRHGEQVLSAALDLLLVLIEQRPELHGMVNAAGCLPPLLAQLVQGNSRHSLQAACILTGMTENMAVLEGLGQEPALAALLKVLQDAKSLNVRLAAVHILRRLAAATPGCVQLLTAHGAVPTILQMLDSVTDSDMRRAAVGLLQLLGQQVVIRHKPGRSGSSLTSTSSSSKLHRAAVCSADGSSNSGAVGGGSSAQGSSCQVQYVFVGHCHSPILQYCQGTVAGVIV
eukprot:GHRR01005517.1.p1 GENE.GHRR01005517.1~~GHRR01005517.1.p1  ORF type:complete len:672 (+),score=302.85 GHRR01005517.1:809-2824(+)